MISQVMNLWGLFEEDYHQNIPKKDTLNLLVNLVSRETFEDILTSLNSSRISVHHETDRWAHFKFNVKLHFSFSVLKIIGPAVPSGPAGMERTEYTDGNLGNRYGSFDSNHFIGLNSPKAAEDSNVP